nr:hypothetical protein 12 [Saccharospirillaceae bacterium]
MLKTIAAFFKKPPTQKGKTMSLKKYATSISFLMPALAFGWNTATGTVETINFYSTTSTVLVELSTDGTAVSECNNNTLFAVDGTQPEARRNQMVSALLAAKASGNTVSISYSTSGGCVAYGSNTNAFRGIKRLTSH